MKNDYDIIIVGGGVAGLWIGSILHRAGYNLILVEKEKLGAGQTLASQGMIHGGQKYALQGLLNTPVSAISDMPQRWEASFAGRGDIDLSSVRFLSKEQMVWPAGSALSIATVLAVAWHAKAPCSKLNRKDYPEALKRGRNITGPVYLLPEKVIDVRSLILQLAKNLDGRIVKADIAQAAPDGTIEISGRRMRAGFLIFAAGQGNEAACDSSKNRLTQRRPLRQVMVRPLAQPLFGHGFGLGRRPRVTVTSHSIGQGEYVWYLGGEIAEKGAKMDAGEAFRFARSELEQMFPHMNWAEKEWAGWHGDRAEPLDRNGNLPGGPYVYRAHRILLAWPTKLTFVPALSDRIAEHVRELVPTASSPPPELPAPGMGCYPWEAAAWQRIA